MTTNNISLNQDLLDENQDLPNDFLRQAIISKAERDAGELEGYEFGTSQQGN